MRVVYAVIFTLGVLGILIGFLPAYYTNDCVIRLTDYGGKEGVVSVYIDVFERLRLSYAPYLLVSIVSVFVGIGGLFGLFSLEHVVVLLSAYATSLLPLTLALSRIRVTAEITASGSGVSYIARLEGLRPGPAVDLILFNGYPVLLVIVVLFTLFTLILYYPKR